MWDKFILVLDWIIVLLFFGMTVEYWIWGLPYSEAWASTVSLFMAILLGDRAIKKWEDMNK